MRHHTIHTGRPPCDGAPADAAGCSASHIVRERVWACYKPRWCRVAHSCSRMTWSRSSIAAASAQTPGRTRGRLSPRGLPRNAKGPRLGTRALPARGSYPRGLLLLGRPPTGGVGRAVSVMARLAQSAQAIDGIRVVHPEVEQFPLGPRPVVGHRAWQQAPVSVHMPLIRAGTEGITPEQLCTPMAPAGIIAATSELVACTLPLGCGLAVRAATGGGEDQAPGSVADP